MALRHIKDGERSRLCRKLTGTFVGFVCEAHNSRCVICGMLSEASAPVRICDECGVTRKVSIPLSLLVLKDPAVEVEDDKHDVKQQRCIVCNRERAVHVASYCRSCSLLEKDRDGCPVVVNLCGGATGAVGAAGTHTQYRVQASNTRHQ